VQSHSTYSKTTSRLLVHCSASSVKAKRCMRARVHSITESRGSEQWHAEDTVMSLYMYIVQESCTWLSGTDTTIKNIGTHKHKFHHPLVAQHFYIYNTQRLHVSAIYPGHLQGVTSLLDLYSLYIIHPGHLQGVCSTCATYIVTRTNVEETCNSLKMARMWPKHVGVVYNIQTLSN
jgi:hypothetical protein